MTSTNRQRMPALWSNLSGRLRSPVGVSLLLGSLIFAGILGLRLTGILQPLELDTYDYLLTLRPTIPPNSPIVLIGETEQDIHRFGHPLSDDLLADILERLDQAHPRIIGVDKYRDLPVPPGSAKLNALLARKDNIIWVMKFGGAGTDHPPVLAPKVLQETDRIGFSDIPLDNDGIVRRGLLFMDDKQQFARSFPLVVALHYLRQEDIAMQPDTDQPQYLKLGKVTIPPLAANVGGYIHADTAGYQFLLDYHGASTPLPRYSLADLLDGRIPAIALRDKIVLFGGMAESLSDFFHTPMNRGAYILQNGLLPGYQSAQPIYGVELQALIVSQLLRFALDGVAPVRSLTESQELIWIWGWCLLGGLLCLQRLTLPRLLAYTALTWLILMAVCYVALSFHWWLPLAPAWLGCLLTAASSTGYLSIHERAEKQLIMQLFARHVSPEVADAIWQGRAQLLEGGRLRTQRLTATVLFTDISGFTAIAEKLEPAVLLEWLNTYLAAMTQVVMRHGGVVNKYIGDAVMALFGVPIPRLSEIAIAQDATQSVQCALAMAVELERLNAQWQTQGLPAIAMRVGIYTGPLVAGSLGSSQRLEYTVIGDTVNIASRLEAFQKEDAAGASGACRILIGATTQRYLDEQFQVEPVGLAKLKGKKEEIAVYRVLDRRY